MCVKQLYSKGLSNVVMGKRMVSKKKRIPLVTLTDYPFSILLASSLNRGKEV